MDKNIFSLERQVFLLNFNPKATCNIKCPLHAKNFEICSLHNNRRLSFESPNNMAGLQDKQQKTGQICKFCKKNRAN